MRKFECVNTGYGVSTIYPSIDFETYSPCGYVWNEISQKFESPPGTDNSGLPLVGMAKYSEHPETEILSLAYDLKNGKGVRLWIPGTEHPTDLFEYVINGGIIEAWNCAFERWIWGNVAVRMGFPRAAIWQWRDAAAKARAFGLPGKLANAGDVLNITLKKDKDGDRLIKKFSIPVNPTKKNLLKRNLLQDDPVDANKLYQYNIRDVEAECEISRQCPDLNSNELKFWLCDQAINQRGVKVDLETIDSCIAIVEQLMTKYNNELKVLTGGEVSSASEILRLKKWINDKIEKSEFSAYIRTFSDLQSETIELELKKLRNFCAKNENNPNFSVLLHIVRALEIRQLTNSAAIKKLYAMKYQACKDGRVRDLFIYHSARTGRAAGTGPQPQNLPNHGPTCSFCENCNCHSGVDLLRGFCPWCGHTENKHIEWNEKAVKDAIALFKTKNLTTIEYFFENVADVISGSLRGMFIADHGKDLICSDYSSIEAVILAALAGEEWRLDVFRTHGKIYEMSASKITGIPFEEFERHFIENGAHHPARKKIGKVAELASGYGGWIGAWKAFGADEFFSDEEIKQHILTWRKASPAITEFWGGQQKNWQPCLFGLEGAVIQAIQNPGIKFSCRAISYILVNDVLYCELPSKRHIVYHKPRLEPAVYPRSGFSISYETWNTNPKYGSIGWIRLHTYAGKLTENVVQAVARDILAHAIVNLEQRGYPVVLHIHDEIVSEIPKGFGSIEEFESILNSLPDWASNWPIVAKGGWRDERYRK